MANDRHSCIILNFCDGDTVRCLIKCNSCQSWHDSYVRLKNIESYELRTSEHKEAREAAIKLNQMFGHKDAELVASQNGSEKYGRIVGDIYLNGKSLAESIIEMGLAWKVDSNHKHIYNHENNLR